MGTRSLIHFKQDDQTILTIYRQFDGYPEGRGKELAEFVASKTLVNGIPMGEDATKLANGFGCLAAQWLAQEKFQESRDGIGAGGVYIYPPGANDCWEEYTYLVTLENEVVKIECPEISFKGTAQNLLEWIEKEAE